jgi:polar amino acid transport system substrate-binding protein
MKRFLALVIALMAIAAVSATAEAGADNSLQDILDKGQFVIGLDVGFPPMGFVDADTGDIVGFDIDLAREVAKRLGVELVTQPINWDAKEMELNAHHIDAIWNGMTITPGRLETMSISLPYMANLQVVVVREADGITGLAGLAGKKLGIQAGSSANDALDAAADFKASLGEVVPFDDNLTALMDLNQGGVDAVVLDVIVATYNMTINDYPFAVLEETLAEEEFGIGFRKGDVLLRDKVDELLLEMAADGTLKAISEEWFGTDITTVVEE